MSILNYNTILQTPMLLLLIYDIVTTIRSLCFSLAHDFGKGDKETEYIALIFMNSSLDL